MTKHTTSRRTIGFLALLLSLFVYSCVHESFPAPPPGMGSDTIKDPTDTTNKPPDTTQGPQIKPCDPDTIYFNRDVLPIFAANCSFQGCHHAASPSKGIILDSYQNVITTAKVEGGDLEAGKLYEVITDTDPNDRMPPSPRKALTGTDIDIIRKWIVQGAQNLSCEACDTTNISYQLHIKPIFDQSCAPCHSGSGPSGGLLLTNYTNRADAVLNNQVLPRINHRNGLPVMPPSGVKLDDCKLKQIDAWVAAGLPNN